MAHMVYSRPTRLLISAMWILQIFVLSLFAVAPQADDYWLCVNSNGAVSRCFALEASDPILSQADNSHSQNFQLSAALSSKHCRFMLIDPDGDTLSPLTKAAVVAPDVHAVLPMVWPSKATSLLQVVLSSQQRRGPPLSAVARLPFSLRAPPLC